MIAHLTGRIMRTHAHGVVLSVGGVGYDVVVSAYTLGKIAGNTEEVSLFIHTHVREDILALYGFLDEAELQMFKLLISVSGVGPKAALGILSVADVGTISSSVLQKDISILTKVSGVGKRMAEKVIVELQNKVDHLVGGEAKDYTSGDGDVIDALVSMGYSVSEARDALKGVPEDVADTSEKIRLALKNRQTK
jgi:Holliday junction DNA helicase RuvA